MFYLKYFFLICLNCVIKGCDCSNYWHPNPVKYVGSLKEGENVSNIDFCDKNICIIDADRIALWMNHSANPCDNFYKYVCGSFLHYVN